MKIRSFLFALSLIGLAPAQAVEFGLRLEGGPAFTLELLQDSQQQPQHGVGGGVELRGWISPSRWLDIQLTGAFVGIPAAPSYNNRYLLGGVGAGLRLKWPYDEDLLVHPWVDADVLYANNGGSHFGYDVGAGLSINCDEAGRWYVGPFLRYIQVVTNGVDDKILLTGIEIEYGSAHFKKKPKPAPAPVPVVVAPPPPPPDRDHDGVPDAKDKCPDVAGPVDNHGCPPDKDGDGVPDADDKCPDVAGPVENHGCPPDKDGDGVPDADDKCPDVAGPVENHGCPPDKDGDGVPDAEDNCPDVAGPVDNHGCPVYKQVVIQKGKIEIKQKVFFANDQTKILPKSFGLLDEVAQVLKENAALRVRVEGHTDNKGKPKRNEILSDGRAASVRTYLIKKGVAADRLEAKGYGATVPVGDNATAVGREANRRVEFVLIGGQ